ncbi:MAG: ABC transporter ATP-binding protein [Spirochaetales bacterium]|jgi:branched-chain amino acid transport system ATP-binding protein|nr:ABC transporter ATP-binding protein [Spirochaetales bacterium]
MALLRIEKLSRYFGGLHAVAGVDLTVNKGTIKGVIGPNGAGKTTVFNLIAGNLPVSSGKIFFEDDEITGLKPFRIAERGIFRTFQTIRLCARMSVLENVMLGRHVRTRSGFVSSVFRPPWTWKEERTIRERSLEILDLLGITDLADEDALNLPFGRQRAVEFARALAAEPKLLLLDEPASGLNIHETEELSQLIRDIREMGNTILLVEHDMSLVMEICDEVAVLNFGQKLAEGTPTEIQKNPEVVEVYLGAEANGDGELEC